MEQIQQPLPNESECRVEQFASFLGSVVSIEDLFGDDGLAGDSEPRNPLPPRPPATAAYQEYLAPVYELHPPMPVQETGRRLLRLVYSA